MQERFKPGQIVFLWHDTVAFGHTQMYAEILKVNRLSLRVRWEDSLGGHINRLLKTSVDGILGDKSAEEIKEEYFKK